jgi:hypothetical protein
VCAGQVSARLAEFSAYYANRLSYAGVAELLVRLSGERLLSDQQIRQLVVDKAVTVSQQWAVAVEGSEVPAPLDVAERVDYYDAPAAEVLLLADAICVKQQKATRQRGERRGEAAKSGRETVRVNTDVWLVERASGGFHFLSAGIDEGGQEVVRVEARVRQYMTEQYGERQEPLPVVAITDGAKAIRTQLQTIFGHKIPVILDWYHLEKKVGELMSMVARNKAEKETHIRQLLHHLWRGEVRAALEYLRTKVAAKNEERRAALLTYLEKHQHEIIDYERRQRTGKRIGSGRMEKGVDQVIGARQKGKGMSWSPMGSKALGILKVIELNHQWEALWFPEQAAA